MPGTGISKLALDASGAFFDSAVFQLAPARRRHFSLPFIVTEQESRLRLCHYPPDDPSDIIGDKQRAGPINDHPNRPPESLVGITEKVGQDIHRFSSRSAVGKWDVDHFVSTLRYAVP